MLNDREVRLSSLLAGFAWAASILALASAWVFTLPYLGMIGVALSTVGATMTVLGSLRRAHSLQREAFDLGRDSVRSVR